MKHNCWRVPALGVPATGLMFFVGGRFNFISTALDTTLLLLLLPLSVPGWWAGRSPASGDWPAPLTPRLLRRAG